VADTVAENEKAQQETKIVEPAPPPTNPGRKFIVMGVVLLLVLGAVFFYWRSTFIEDTDDAQVEGNLYQISSRIAGQVVKVYRRRQPDRPGRPGARRDRSH
jgi:membrane fusion protein (multidrug efflux system)